ncbi:MAG: hypothetical protein II772_06395, partial [Lachnospiraceae bacterium]|nr:hypothetical protein [Lachnospiraceae bacterium]
VYRSAFQGRASMLPALPQGPVRCGSPALPGGRHCPQVPARLAVSGKMVLYCNSKNAAEKGICKRGFSDTLSAMMSSG